MKRIIILISLYIVFHSCTDCKRDAKYIFKEEFNLVIEIPPSEYSELFKTKGYDPVTKEIKNLRSFDRWLDFYKKEIEEGDTIVKKRGELVFYIHKKDTVIAHEWVCYDGKGKHTYTNK